MLVFNLLIIKQKKHKKEENMRANAGMYGQGTFY